MKSFVLSFLLSAVAFSSTSEAGQDNKPELRKPKNVTCAAEALQLLDYYRAMDMQALHQMKGDLDFVFSEYAKAVPAFVNDVNDLGSKLKFCWKKVRPGGESAKQYVHRLWRHHIFTAGRLKSDLSKVVVRFQAKINDNRSMLLVDLADMPFFDEEFATEVGFDKYNDESTARFNDHCNRLVAQNVSAEVITEIATEVVTAAVLKGAGILGAGTAGSFQTLGISLAVAVAADMAVNGYMEKRMDKKLTIMLQEISSALWDGNANADGIKSMMLNVLEEEWLTRRKLAAKALKKQNDRLLKQEVR